MSQLWLLGEPLLRLGQFALKLVYLGAKLTDLPAGLECVGEPVPDVPDRRQDRAGSLLDRREDLDDAPLNRVQGAGWRLAEVVGEKDQGDDDEHNQNCSSPSNLL